MAEKDELTLLRSLSEARDSGDARAELEALRALSALRKAPSAQPAQPQLAEPSLGQRAAARFVANVLGTPSGIGELLEIGAAGLQAGAGAALDAVRPGPSEQSLGQRFATAREQQSQLFPAAQLQAIPSPSTEQVLAGVESFKNLPSIIHRGEQLRLRSRGAVGGFPQAAGSEFSEQLQTQQQQAQQHPITAGAGDVLGDIGTLVSMRPATGRMFRPARARAVIPKETVDIIDSAANRLTRATGFAKKLGAQAGEAGFEGALLAAMGDGDPLATAGWQAGAQVGGSLALQGTKAFKTYPWRTLGGIALAHWVWRAFAPGGQGALEDVRDETVQTMLTTFGLGTLAALAGAGRLAPGKTAGRDRFIDAFDTIRRSHVASYINQFTEAEESGQTALPVIIGKIVEDPNFFGPEVRRRIERAANSNKDNALIREVESLMRSERFRRKVEELD